MIAPRIHRLHNGATVLTTSKHGFTFSDGSHCGPQHEAVCDALQLQRDIVVVNHIRSMRITATRMRLAPEPQALLAQWAQSVDIVIVALPVLLALREMGIRERFANCLSVNTTEATRRAPANQKVVDIDNWSW